MTDSPLSRVRDSIGLRKIDLDGLVEAGVES